MSMQLDDDQIPKHHDMPRTILPSLRCSYLFYTGFYRCSFV